MPVRLDADEDEAAALVEQVRLLTADTDPDNPLFTDEQLEAFLVLEDANVKRAAADALDATAVSEALVSKVIKTQDLSTDGAKVAAALHAQADGLRVQAARDADAGFAFDIVDYNPHPRVPEQDTGP